MFRQQRAVEGESKLGQICVLSIMLTSGQVPSGVASPPNAVAIF